MAASGRCILLSQAQLAHGEEDPLRTKLMQQGPLCHENTVSSIGPIDSRAPRQLFKAGGEERGRKTTGAGGVYSGSPPQLNIRNAMPCHTSQNRGSGRAGGVGTRVGKKPRGSRGLAENKSHHIAAVTLSPNWFRQTKLHCPLTRTNKPARERLKCAGGLKYLP